MSSSTNSSSLEGKRKPITRLEEETTDATKALAEIVSKMTEEQADALIAAFTPAKKEVKKEKNKVDFEEEASN